MTKGKLEVYCQGGRGLKNPDKVGKVMVIFNYKDQEQRTQPVVCECSTDPEWAGEKLHFHIDCSCGTEDLKVRVHDGDEVTDAEVGHCSIPLDTLLESGHEADIVPHPYDVTRRGNCYGEIIVGLHFYPEEC